MQRQRHAIEIITSDEMRDASQTDCDDIVFDSFAARIDVNDAAAAQRHVVVEHR